MNNEVSIINCDYFTYHPPITDARKEKHDRVNKACLHLAQILMSCIEDESLRIKAIDCIQQARMFANQGITVDELRKLRGN